MASQGFNFGNKHLMLATVKELIFRFEALKKLNPQFEGVGDKMHVSGMVR